MNRLRQCHVIHQKMHGVWLNASMSHRKSCNLFTFWKDRIAYLETPEFSRFLSRLIFVASMTKNQIEHRTVKFRAALNIEGTRKKQKCSDWSFCGDVVTILFVAFFFCVVNFCAQTIEFPTYSYLIRYCRLGVYCYGVKFPKTYSKWFQLLSLVKWINNQSFLIYFIS